VAPGGTSAATGATSAAPGAGALSAEAHSAATGDIPDNQVFLVYTDRTAGYSIRYPEGWTQSGTTNDVTLRDKNNIVHLFIGAGPAPTVASVTRSLAALRASTPSLVLGPVRVARVGGRRVVKAIYTTRSAPNPVTGKSVTLLVDRYAVGLAGRTAVIDMGTPRGVDNVDAYRMMIESFHWR
jgi:hypothetical protein